MTMEKIPESLCHAEILAPVVRQWEARDQSSIALARSKAPEPAFKRAFRNQFLEMTIDCFTQASKILTPVDTASLQLVRKVRSGTSEGLI